MNSNKRMGEQGKDFFYEPKDCIYAVLRGNKIVGSFSVPLLYGIDELSEESGFARLEFRGECIAALYAFEKITMFDSVESAVEYCVSDRINRIDVARQFAQQRPKLEGRLMKIIAEEIEDTKERAQ